MSSADHPPRYLPLGHPELLRCQRLTGPLEAVNNKIKLLQRMAFDFRDHEFFKLRIMGFHEAKYTLTG
ncbi:MAG: transposase [Candidatus Tectomicrobia bacterium]|nr:transposase [Candidatus Tectomicrobia bacterium]